MNPDREQIQVFILSKLTELCQDWDTTQDLGPDTLIFTGLGFESLDAVILGVSIQDHYSRQMPFAELFAELGEHRRDLSVAELVDFVHQHVAESCPQTAGASRIV